MFLFPKRHQKLDLQHLEASFLRAADNIALFFEEVNLPPPAPGVTAGSSVGANNPMTWDRFDINVFGKYVTDGAISFRATGQSSDLPVREYPAAGYFCYDSANLF